MPYSGPPGRNRSRLRSLSPSKPEQISRGARLSPAGLVSLSHCRPERAALALPGAAKDGAGAAPAVYWKLRGANPMASGELQQPTGARSHYLVGNDPKKWRSNVALYSKLRYQDVYPGVDLVYYGNNQPPRI